MTALATLRQIAALLIACADPTVKWRLPAVVVLVTAAGMTSALAPLALKAMVDTWTPQAASRFELLSPSALLLATAYLGAIGTGRVLAELRPLLMGAAEQRLLKSLTQRCFAHLLALPLRFHLDRSTGAPVHAIQMAAQGCQLLLSHSVNSVLPVLAELATVVFVLSQLGQPPLVWTFAVTASAYLCLFAGSTSHISTGARAVAEASTRVNASIADSLQNCEALKTTGTEAASQHDLARAGDALERSWGDLRLQRARLGAAVAAIFIGSVTVTLMLATHALSTGALTIGGFVLANVYMVQVVRPIEMLGVAVRDMTQALAFVGPLMAMMREPPEQAWPPRAAGANPLRRDAAQCVRTDASSSPDIRLEGVGFGYEPGRPALRSLDLWIRPGKVLAIVGASGSGKSSILRLLLRLYEPTSGRILIAEHDIRELPLGELRALYGVVLQDTILFNDSIANNIGLGRPGAPRQAIERAARQAELHDFVINLPKGYDTSVGQRGLKLSGGERQRVSIARMLLQPARVLLLDEATSMLDAETEARILHNIRSNAQGRTLITVTHSLATASHADEIVVMDHGAVRERGTHLALIARGGAYAAMWHEQVMADPATTARGASGTADGRIGAVHRRPA